MKRIPYFVLVLGLLIIPRVGYADDVEAFTASSSKPNVLIIYDNSSSMSDKIAYDDSVNYSAYMPKNVTTLCDEQCCRNVYDREAVYNRLADCCGPIVGNGSVICSEGNCHISSGYCDEYKYRRADNQENWQDADKDGQDDRNVLSTFTTKKFKGNYINWEKYFNQRKYQEARTAVLNLVQAYQDKINLGLMTFRKDDTLCPYKDPTGSHDLFGNLFYYYHSDGGEVVVPINKKLDEFATTYDAFSAWLWDPRCSPDGVHGNAPQPRLAKCAETDSNFKTINGRSYPPAQTRDLMFTPLAEALTSAGMYFEAGWKGDGFYYLKDPKNYPEFYCPDYNSHSGDAAAFFKNTCKSLPFDVPRYGTDINHFYFSGPSPIQASCQKNFVIILTDGYPTNDGNKVLLSKYLNNVTLNNNEMQLETSYQVLANIQQHYLDDVAQVLHERDLRPDLPNDPNPAAPGNGKNLTTYIIGFGLEKDNPLLSTAAANGGGAYFTAGSSDTLYGALDKIAQSTIVNSSVIVPNVAIPTDGMVSSGNMYVPYVYPSANGLWYGDLKKFAIDKGQITAGADILLSSSASWGTAAKLKTQGNERNIYTYLGTKNALTDTENLFSESNANNGQGGGKINRTILGIDGNNPLPKDVIKFIRGFNQDGTARARVLGDILHSNPLAVKYDKETVIYFGANDGMLHAISDADGKEKWAFIPPINYSPCGADKPLCLLKNMLDPNVTHPYYVDSSPKLVELNSSNFIASPGDKVAARLLVFGLRKGGSSYHALKITDPDKPEYLWEATPTNLTELGQTWSEPVFGHINVSGTKTPVAFFGGGYSADNSKGRAVYAVYLTGDKAGTIAWSVTNANLSGTMIYSIPSTVLPYDADDDGIIDRVYVGDLGGQMWVFNLNPSKDDSWTSRLLFKAPGMTRSGGGADYLRIFYPPDLVKEHDGNYLYFGTGNRESPVDSNAGVVNRLYCVKDKDRSSAEFKSLSESNLLELTADDLQESTDSAKRGQILSQLKAKDGWFIKLENKGEKVLAAATVFFKVAYYTTFTPGSSGNDCGTGGIARVYALHYTTGESVFDASNGNFTSSGKGKLGKADRSVTFSNLAGIPSEVLITIIPPKTDSNGKIKTGEAVGGTLIPLVASGGGITTPGSTNMVNPLMPYSWRPTNP